MHGWAPYLRHADGGNGGGGIPEQVEENDVTGFLVPLGDGGAMAERVLRLLGNEELRQQMRQQAADDAQRRFGLKRQVDDYLAWYSEILECWK